MHLMSNEPVCVNPAGLGKACGVLYYVKSVMQRQVRWHYCRLLQGLQGMTLAAVSSVGRPVATAQCKTV